MCENTQEEFILPAIVQDYNKIRKCLKCDEKSVVVTRVNEAMCRECFLEYFIHKFRSTIGKGRLFEPNEVVLFPYSGSSSSVAMLHLIKQGISEHAKKKFQFKPVLLYIEDSLTLKYSTRENRLNNINKIKSMTGDSEFKIYYTLIESVFSDKPLITDDGAKITFDEQLESKFQSLIQNVTSLTSKEELVKRLKLHLIFQISEFLNIKKIMLAINCTKLTVEILSNISIGKAAHLHAEVALKDLRNNFTILRPLRELTAKEIAFYNYYCKNNEETFNKLTALTPINSTIYRLTERFVNNLQRVNPTTLATIFRTSDKVTKVIEEESVNSLKNDNGNDLCALCGLTIERKSQNATCAINDVTFSKVLTLNDVDSTSNEENDKLKHTLYNSMCYSCGLILRDSKDFNAYKTFLKQNNENRMKESIKDYLLDENE